MARSTLQLIQKTEELRLILGKIFYKLGCKIEVKRGLEEMLGAFGGGFASLLGVTCARFTPR